MYKVMTVLAGTLVLQGCASSLSALYNRPVVEDRVPGVLSTFSLSADRRNVIIPTAGANSGKFCAEPPPDSATQLKSELEASLEGKAKQEKIKADLEGKGTLKDKLETTVVVLADRTPALDAFRTGVYALCQYRMNGWMTDEQINSHFKLLIESFTLAHNFAKSQESALDQTAPRAQAATKPAGLTLVIPQTSQVIELPR